MGDQPQFRVEDFDLEKLAQGSYGIVYKAVRKGDGRVFALKQIKLEGLPKVERAETLDEARMLAQLNYPHVTKHYGSWIDPTDKKLYILMEYASKGNVSTVIKSFKGKQMPEDMIWRVFIQSVLGLSYIHSKRIIHRDIKALNLFLDYQNNIKIGDFGVARVLGDGSDFALTVLGTPFYLSPELCEEKPYSYKSDIWALGVVLYECCTGTYPFNAPNEGALIRKIMAGKYAPITQPYSQQLIAMVTACLTKNPQQRPDTATLLRNPQLLAKAKQLGIDMNPRMDVQHEDHPVYDQRQSQQQQQYGGMPGPSSQQYPSGGNTPLDLPQKQPHANSYMNYPPYNMGPPVGQGAAVGYGAPGAGQGPGRPGSAPMHRPPLQQQAAPGAHPFDLPAGYQEQQRQRQGAPISSPYALDNPGVGGNDYWDQLAGEMNKLQVGSAEYKRLNQERQQQLAHNRQQGARDEARGLLAPGYDATPQQQQQQHRMRPEDMPAAGGRPLADRNGAAPFALHYAAGASTSRIEQSAAWTAKLSPPQYGRKRAPDLMVAGPTVRSGPGVRPGSARPYSGRAADDATTYVSSSYHTSYYQ